MKLIDEGPSKKSIEDGGLNWNENGDAKEEIEGQKKLLLAVSLVSLK